MFLFSYSHSHFINYEVDRYQYLVNILSAVIIITFLIEFLGAAVEKQNDKMRESQSFMSSPLLVIYRILGKSLNHSSPHLVLSVKMGSWTKRRGDGC